eukprot:5796484-Karenia_brevis.AAC.1
MDIGCTDSLMTTAWREHAQRRLASFGFQMLPIEGKNKTFRGIGGVRIKSQQMWQMPTSIH